MSRSRLPAFTAIASLAMASLAAVCAHASNYPKQLEPVLRAGGTVVKTFDAASNLKGWVLSKQGHYMVVYTTPDNKTLLAGDLIDESGRNLTAQYLAQYAPKPDLAHLFPELEQSAYVAERGQGTPKSVIYAFFDPNCPFCHLAWKALQPYEKAGLEVRWVPVAYLSASSAGKAAAIMEAKDSAAAFRSNEQNYDEKNHAGGIAPLAKPAAGTRQMLQANAALMQKFGAVGTPAIVWQDSTGAVQMKAGLPRLSELPAITGLPEQPESDPELARFR